MVGSSEGENGKGIERGQWGEALRAVVVGAVGGVRAERVWVKSGAGVGVVGGVRAEGVWARIAGLEIILEDWEGTARKEWWGQ